MRKRLAPLDLMFLFAETRETMMHVATLLVFAPPVGAPPEFLRNVMDEIKHAALIEAPWNQKLSRPGFLRWPLQAWVDDPAVDLDYHVRRAALPAPGDERELGILVSQLHSQPLDFSRPPWEVHLIEGLERGRFALYAKIHHALVDGYTGARMLARSLSQDPTEKNASLFFSKRHATAVGKQAMLGPDGEPMPNNARTLLRRFSQAGRSVAGVTGALLNLIRKPGEEFAHLVSSFQAPDCILNRRIGRSRRLATQQYSLARLQALGKAADGTLNDIVLAICAGGLRKFLAELGELPAKPLIAFLPVNVRPKHDAGGGNAVGAMLASLATDIADPRARLAAIIASTKQAKAQMEDMSQKAIIAYSALLMAPTVIQTLRATNLTRAVSITFNVCISNIPGPDHPLYFRGALLEDSYPVSIPMHGMALNITLYSYNGTLNFGFIGCRDTLPHLQHLAVYTGEALLELEQALVEPKVRGRRRVKQ